MPLPELLDAVLERFRLSGDAGQQVPISWNNLLELRSVTTRYEPEDALDRLLGARRRPGRRYEGEAS